MANHVSVQGFIVDFYCQQAGLVVEVNGNIYDLQEEEDERREMALRVARFGNDEIMKSLPAIVRKIKAMISE